MIWKKLVLEKACSLITRGIAPKYLESGGVRVLNQKCIRNHVIDFNLARRHDISKKSVKQERFIQKGDVLINSTGQGTLGRVAQVRENPSEPTTVDSHITIVRPNAEFFYLEFFGYAAIFIEEKIKAAGQGVGGQTELSKTKLKEEFYVSFPSDLGQQQRIVAKLDAAFAQIDETLNATKSNLYKLDKFRRLYLSAEMNKADNNYKLGEICELEKNQGNFKNMIYVGMEDIESGTGKFIGDMQPKEVKSKTFRFGSNNLLYGRLRPYLNKVLLPEFDGHCSTEIYPIKVGKKILREYLFYWFIQDKTVESINSSTTGARMPRANLNKILEMKINLPSLEQQRRGLKRIINVDKKITTMKDAYSTKLNELRNLKRALLFKVLQEKAIN